MKTGTKMERCTGCGECCKAIPCQISMTLLGLSECPALEKDGKIYRCGLVLHPQKYIDLEDEAEWRDTWFGHYIGGMLGIGMGCDSEGVESK